MLKIQQFVFNPFTENTYVIWDDVTNEAAIIDAGCYDQKEESEIKEFIASQSLSLKHLINTHCHIDHIFGNSFIKKTFNCKFIAPEKDLFLLDLMIEQAEIYGTHFNPSPQPDELIGENIPLMLGNSIGKFIFTPGHTPGGYCLYFEKEKICFTGDVLFREGIGRTDLWRGDYKQLIDSIKSKLFTLPEDVSVFSGHGESSTIGYEKKFNPFFQD